MAFEAILWDNDGVLVDTEELYFRATREALAKAGVELTERLYVDHFLVDGRGAWHLAAEHGIPDVQIAELRAWRNARYNELLAVENVLLEGARDALVALRPHYRMAIVTSCRGEHFATMHRATRLLDSFELVLTREHYEEAKPHPEPYLRAIERMNLRPEKCLAIEDSERGLRAAKAAGLECWVIPRGLSRYGHFDLADRAFTSLAALVRDLLDRG